MAAVTTATPSEAVAAATPPMLVNGGSGAVDEENWVEVSGSGLQTASEAAVSSDPQWQQVAAAAPVVAPEQNWTYIDASGFESIAVYNGILIAPTPTQPPPPLPSHDAVFRPRGSRGRGGGGRGHYNRGISSNNVSR